MIPHCLEHTHRCAKVTRRSRNWGSGQMPSLFCCLMLTFLGHCSGFPATPRYSSSGAAPRARYKLYRSNFPLEGGPRQLRLHVAIVIEEIKDHCDQRSGNSDDGQESENLVLFDFLPQEPTALTTVARLLIGGEVKGNLRTRTLRYLPRGATCVGESTATLGDMQSFASEYPDRLSLLSNNCVTFVDSFVARFSTSREESPPNE